MQLLIRTQERRADTQIARRTHRKTSQSCERPHRAAENHHQSRRQSHLKLIISENFITNHPWASKVNMHHGKCLNRFPMASWEVQARNDHRPAAASGAAGNSVCSQGHQL